MLNNKCYEIYLYSKFMVFFWGISFYNFLLSSVIIFSSSLFARFLLVRYYLFREKVLKNRPNVGSILNFCLLKGILIYLLFWDTIIFLLFTYSLRINNNIQFFSFNEVQAPWKLLNYFSVISFKQTLKSSFSWACSLF